MNSIGIEYSVEYKGLMKHKEIEIVRLKLNEIYYIGHKDPVEWHFRKFYIVSVFIFCSSYVARYKLV